MYCGLRLSSERSVRSVDTVRPTVPGSIGLSRQIFEIISSLVTTRSRFSIKYRSTEIKRGVNGFGTSLHIRTKRLGIRVNGPKEYPRIRKEVVYVMFYSVFFARTVKAF